MNLSLGVLSQQLNTSSASGLCLPTAYTYSTLCLPTAFSTYAIIDKMDTGKSISTLYYFVYYFSLIYECPPIIIDRPAVQV